MSIRKILKTKEEVSSYIENNSRAKEQIKILKALLENKEVNKTDFGLSSVKSLIEKGFVEEKSYDRLKKVEASLEIKEKDIFLLTNE